MPSASPLQIQALTHGDAAAYRALMLQAYALDADAFTSTPQERATAPMRWWCDRIADAGGLTQAFGALDAGSLKGAVAVEYNTKPKTVHLKRGKPGPSGPGGIARGARKCAA